MLITQTGKDSWEGLSKDTGMESLFVDGQGLRQLKMSLGKSLWLDEENEEKDRQM